MAKHSIKVIVIGDASVGKTSLIQMYQTGQFQSLYKNTIGADFFLKEIQLDGNQVVNMQIWDTAGQERF